MKDEKRAFVVLKNELMHPIRIANYLVNDTQEMIEDFIDWKAGTLPVDIRLSRKAFSVLSRTCGLVMVVSPITFTADLLIALSATPLTLARSAFVF